jgi:hypothetical protein
MKKGNGNLLPLPFFMLEKKKTTTMHRCLLLWCYWNKEGDGNKLLSPFFLCLKRRRRKGRHGNVLLSSSMVVL